MTEWTEEKEKAALLEQIRREEEERQTERDHMRQAEQERQEERMRQMEEKFNKEMEQQREEIDRALESKLREQEDLLNKGFREKAELLKEEIKNLKEQQGEKDDFKKFIYKKCLNTTISVVSTVLQKEIMKRIGFTDMSSSSLPHDLLSLFTRSFMDKASSHD